MHDVHVYNLISVRCPGTSVLAAQKFITVNSSEKSRDGTKRPVDISNNEVTMHLFHSIRQK